MLFANSTAVVGTVVLLNLLRIVSTIVLTRLLNAEAYGVIGTVTSVSVVFGLISDIGVTAFVVRHEHGLDPRLLDEIWTIRFIRSVTLTILMGVLAFPIAALIQKPELGWPIAVGGLYFVCDGLSSMSFATALREGLVKRLSAIDLIASIFVLLVSIAVAALLHNYWAIIITNLLGQLVRALLSYIWFPNSWRRLRLSWDRWVELWHFARYITGSTIITLILSQTDRLVFSRLFSLHTLGLYVLASNLATAAVGLSTAYAARVLYPHYARCFRETPDLLSLEFYRERLTVTCLYMFGVGGVIGTAELIVTILYDPRYLGATLFLQILSVSALFALNNQATNEMMIAIGRQSFTLHANIVRLVFFVAAGVPAYLAFGSLGLVAVVAGLEVAAQLYGWFCLRRQRLLNWKYELLGLALGGAGFGVGSVVNTMGLMFVR